MRSDTFIKAMGNIDERFLDVEVPKRKIRRRWTAWGAVAAAAVLLIAAILSEKQLSEYRGICDELGLSALVEAHNGAEVQAAIQSGARIIGVNNRNLKDFTVDSENSRRLRSIIPNDIIFVSESGVKTAEDVRVLREIGADAVLIGEALMKAEDKKQKLNELRGRI